MSKARLTRFHVVSISASSPPQPLSCSARARSSCLCERSTSNWSSRSLIISLDFLEFLFFCYLEGIWGDLALGCRFNFRQS